MSLACTRQCSVGRLSARISGRAVWAGPSMCGGSNVGQSAVSWAGVYVPYNCVPRGMLCVLALCVAAALSAAAAVN